MKKDKKNLIIRISLGVFALLVVLLLNLHFFVQQTVVPVTVKVVANETIIGTEDGLNNLPEKMTTAITAPDELRLKTNFNGLWFIILNVVVVVIAVIVIGRVG